MLLAVDFADKVVFVVVEAEFVLMREVELVPLEVEFARGTLFGGVSFDEDLVGKDVHPHRLPSYSKMAKSSSKVVGLSGR